MSQTIKKTVGEIEHFVIGRTSKYVEVASLGWRYATTVDKHFLCDISANIESSNDHKSKKIIQVPPFRNFL